MKWLIRGAYNLGVLAWGSITDIGNYLRLRFVAILIGVGVLLCLAAAIILPRMFPANTLLTFYMGALLLIGLLLGVIFLVAFDRIAETLAFIIQENLIVKNALNQLSNDIRKSASVMERTNNEMDTLNRALKDNAENTKRLTEELGRAKGSIISD